MDSAVPAPDSMREALATLTRYSAELSQVLDDGKRKRRPGVKRPGTPSLAGAHLPVFARNSSLSSVSEIMAASPSQRSSFSTKHNKSTLSSCSVDTAPTTVGSTFIPHFASPRNSADPASVKSHLPTSPASSLKHSSASKPGRPSSANPIPSRSSTNHLPSRGSPKSIPKSCFSTYIPPLPPTPSHPKSSAHPSSRSRTFHPGYSSVPISPTSPVDSVARRLSSSPVVNSSRQNSKHSQSGAHSKASHAIISRPLPSTDLEPNSRTVSMSEATSVPKSDAAIISKPDATIISPPDATVLSKPLASSQSPFTSTPVTRNSTSSSTPNLTSTDDKILPKSSADSVASSSRTRRSEGRIRRRDCYRKIVQQHLDDSTACYVSGSPVVSQFDIDDHVITYDDYKWAAPAWQAYFMAEQETIKLMPDGGSSSKAGPSSAGPLAPARPLNSGRTSPLAAPFSSPSIQSFVAAALADVPLGPASPSSATHEANLVEAALAFQRSKSAKTSCSGPLSRSEEGFAPRRSSTSAVASSYLRPLRTSEASSSARPIVTGGPSSSVADSQAVVKPTGARPPRSPEPSSFHQLSSGNASSSARPVLTGGAASSRSPISRSTSSPTRPPSFLLAPTTVLPSIAPEPAKLRRSSSADSPSPARPPSGFASRSKPIAQEPEIFASAPTKHNDDINRTTVDEIVPEGFFDTSPRLRKKSKRINSAQLPPLPPRDQQQRNRRQHSVKRTVNKEPIDIEPMPEDAKAVPLARGSPRNMRMKSNRLSKLIFSGLRDKSERESSKRSEEITSEGKGTESNHKRRNPVRSATVGPGRTSIGARFRGRHENSSITRSKVNKRIEGDEERYGRDGDDSGQGEGAKPIRQQSYCKTGSVPGLRRTRFMRLIGTELVCYSRDLNRELWKSQVKNAFVKLQETHRKISVYTLVARRPIVFYLASSDMLASWSRALASASATAPPRKYTSQKSAKELQREGVYF